MATGSTSASESVELVSAGVSWGGPFTNAGTISIAGSGSFLNVPGGVFDQRRPDPGPRPALGISSLTANISSSGSIVVDSALTLSSSLSLTNTGSISVGSGIPLSYGGAITNGAGGSITNSGSISVNSNGVFNEGAGVVSGNPVTINNGFLNFTGGGGASSFVISSVGSSVVTGSTSASESVELVSAGVSWGGPFTNAGTISIAGSGSFLNVPGGVFTNTGLIRTEAGPGISSLTANISSSGSIVVDSALTLSSSLSLTNTGSISVGSGIPLSYGGTITNGAGGSITNSGSISVNSNGVFNEGAGVVSGNPVTINNGFLNFTGGGGASSFVISSVGSSVVTGSTSASESVELVSAGVSWGGPFTNAGTISIAGSGSFLNVPGGVFTNTGLIDSLSGAGGATIAGTVVNNGTLHAGTGHTTTINGSYTQGSGGTLAVDLGDATSFGRLAISGTAALDGQLNVTTTGFTPNPGDTFAILHSTGARTGQFAGYTFTGYTYSAQYPANGVTLGTAVPLAITTTSLPSGLAGTPYSGATLASSGGTGAVTWSVPPGSLPPGLSLGGGTGAITGTPTTGGTTTFTVTATDSGSPAQVATKSLSITIASPPTLTSIAVTPASPTIPNGTSQQFTATGTYSDSSTADITSSVTWASDTPAVATISAAGLAHGVSPGTSTISATLGSVSGNTLLTVASTNHPPTVSAGGPYTVAEGGTVTLTATGSDPDGDTLTYAWDLDGNGTFETSGQSPTFTAGDGPATTTVTVRVTDPSGASATASAVVTTTNVAPTATFNAPGTATQGSTFTLSLTSPSDPSAADTAAGFQYAFDCGSGYGAFSAASTTTCTAGTASTLSVGGKIRDKDGGVTVYSGSIATTDAYDHVCALARAYSTKPRVADAVCDDLARARQEAAHGHLLLKQIDLVLAQLTIALESGHAFTHAQAVQLIKLIEAL